MRQKKIFAIVLLLSAVVTGAWAQTTYKVGFDDNSNTEGWTISPTTAADGQTVTVSYAGEHRVKSVTAKTATAPVENVIDLSTLPDKGKTLTIQGTGSLTASAVIPAEENSGAGIGGGYVEYPYTEALKECGNIVIKSGNITAIGGRNGAGIGATICGGSYNVSSCGNIVILGGTVNATGGYGGAGIGSGDAIGGSICGNITITGGTVVARGGEYAAGIGAGLHGGEDCGEVNITNTVTSVTAYKGTDNGGVLHPYSIGTGTYGYAKKVTIGGTVYWDPTDFSDYPALLDVNWLNDGKPILNVSPFVYEP